MLRNLNPHFAALMRECDPVYLEDALECFARQWRHFKLRITLTSIIDVARALATHPKASRAQRRYAVQHYVGARRRFVK